jgi:hypothetical protein
MIVWRGRGDTMARREKRLNTTVANNENKERRCAQSCCACKQHADKHTQMGETYSDRPTDSARVSSSPFFLVFNHELYRRVDMLDR